MAGCSPLAGRPTGNVRQPDRVLANSIAGHKPERRAGAGEERLAATKHDGMEVESILVDKIKLGQASRQLRAGNGNLAGQLILQSAYHRLDIINVSLAGVASRARKLKGDAARSKGASVIS